MILPHGSGGYVLRSAPRKPMAAIENTITIIAIPAMVALLAMNDPAVAAASIQSWIGGTEGRPSARTKEA